MDAHIVIRQAATLPAFVILRCSFNDVLQLYLLHPALFFFPIDTSVDIWYNHLIKQPVA